VDATAAKHHRRHDRSGVMSEFYAKAASSTFHVRDARALRRALTGMAIIVHPATSDGDPNHVYLVSDEDKGCWPSERFDEDSGEGVEVNLLALIALHLKLGEVAVPRPGLRPRHGPRRPGRVRRMSPPRTPGRLPSTRVYPRGQRPHLPV
jgi:hypothetical protein